MSVFREWLLGVVAAALAVSMAQALTPEGAVKRVGRLVGGLVLLLALAKPLVSVDLGDWTAPAMAAAGMTEAQAAQSGEDVMKILIAQKAGAYIVDKGQSLGVTCSAQVTVARDASGWPVPWEVCIRGSWTPEQKEALSKAVEEDLAIPAQRQSFREEGI